MQRFLSILFILMGMATGLSANFQVLEQTVTELGENRMVLRYTLPNYLNNLNAYTSLSYSVSCPGATDELFSCVGLVKRSDERLSEWHVGKSKMFPNAIFSQSGLGVALEAIDIELKTVGDVDWQNTTISLYVDNTLIGGWELTPKFLKNGGDGLEKIKSVSARIGLKDADSPQILSWTVDGNTIQENDYVSSKPTIVVRAIDTNPGIKKWSMTVIDSNSVTQKIVASHDVTETSIETVTKNLTWELDSALLPGKYFIQLNIQDDDGHSVTENSVTFQYDIGVKITYPLVGPNPYNPNVGDMTIQYQLSEEADVHLWLFAIDGEEQWSTRIEKGNEGARIGFNTVKWSGRNNFGERPANGAYVLYLEAKGTDGAAKRKVKVLVLK